MDDGDRLIDSDTSRGGAESMRESSSTRLETFLPPLLWSFEPNKTNPER